MTMRIDGSMTTKTIPGYRVQPGLPMSFPYLGATILDAGFVQHPSGAWCVEVSVRIGLNDTPYILVLSLAQAREADIVEPADEGGCRCPLCNGRSDDPARIHGRR